MARHARLSDAELIDALVAHRGNVARTAAALGYHRVTIYTRARKCAMVASAIRMVRGDLISRSLLLDELFNRVARRADNDPTMPCPAREELDAIITLVNELPEGLPTERTDP